MDLLQQYVQLVTYDGWANLEVIGGFRAAGSAPERSLKFMAHIVAAEHLWRARMLGIESPFSVWPELTVERCEEQARQLPGLWREFLGDDSAGWLDRMVSYKNSKGESYQSIVRDILTHVFMHSAYHRGQIAIDMREAGHVPAYTDFIHAVRQGLVE